MIDTSPLPNNLGVKIHGQLDEFSDFDLRQIPTLVAAHQIVVLEQQDLTPRQFNDINLAWGLHRPVNIWANHPEFPIIFRVTNREVEEGKKGLFGESELDWHCNGIFSTDPEEVVCLFCIQPDGSNTYFTNSVRAYQDLNPILQAALEHVEIEITNNVHRTYLGQAAYSPQLPDEQQALNDIGGRTREGIKDQHGNIKKVRKKLIQTHPLTGAKMIYFPFLSVSKLYGLPDGFDDTKIFEGLKEFYVDSGNYTYEQDWKTGDLILADQLAGIHKRDPIRGDRELWRTAFWYGR